METTVLCANCFSIIPFGTLCSSLLLSDGVNTAVHDRDYCTECGPKLLELVDAKPENSESCGVCRGKVGGQFGYLQIVHKDVDINSCICPACVAALSRNVSALKERREAALQ